MKRTLSIFLTLLILLALPVLSASAEVARVVDEAGLLTDAEYESLWEQLDEVSTTYNVELSVVTVALDGEIGIDDFIEYYYDEICGQPPAGVMLALDMSARDYRILVEGPGTQNVTVRALGDAVQPFLSAGKYATAFGAFAEECASRMGGTAVEEPFPLTESLLISLGIGLVLALIVTGVMLGQLKSVRARFEASDYVKPGSLHVRDARDIYLYNRIIRTKRETKDSDSGGTSRRVGGGKF